jgi:hypothetical protein
VGVFNANMTNHICQLCQQRAVVVVVVVAGGADAGAGAGGVGVDVVVDAGGSVVASRKKINWLVV